MSHFSMGSVEFSDANPELTNATLRKCKQTSRGVNILKCGLSYFPNYSSLSPYSLTSLDIPFYPHFATASCVSGCYAMFVHIPYPYPYSMIFNRPLGL